jgi:hypothetical protein
MLEKFKVGEIVIRRGAKYPSRIVGAAVLDGKPGAMLVTMLNEWNGIAHETELSLFSHGLEVGNMVKVFDDGDPVPIVAVGIQKVCYRSQEGEIFTVPIGTVKVVKEESA